MNNYFDKNNWKKQQNYPSVEDYLSIKINSELVPDPKGSETPINHFLILKFSYKGSNLKKCRIILEHPNWSKANSETFQLTPILSDWEGETAIPKILDLLYEEEGRFSQESLSEDKLNLKYSQHLWVEITMFYSFSDIMVILGSKWGQYITKNLVSGKDLKSKQSWVQLPHLIRDHSGPLDLPLKIKIIDWFGLDYSVLEEECRTYNIDPPSKGVIEKYRACLELASMDEDLRMAILKYAISNWKSFDFAEYYGKT